MFPVRCRSGYNSDQMLNALRLPVSREQNQLGWEELVAACAGDRDNSPLWMEFLRRYGPRIKQFIRGTWRLTIGNKSLSANASAFLTGMQESDLLQAVIVRLVEQDCAAMKRFSGTTEDMWLAYLAVIARSVVRDTLRLQRRQKRPGGLEAVEAIAPGIAGRFSTREKAGLPDTERVFLAHELRTLCEATIKSSEAESVSRNMLIFRLYFDHDLSALQIARCQGVNLSKAGVEKVINRLKDRIRSVVSPDAPEAAQQ